MAQSLREKVIGYASALPDAVSSPNSALRATQHGMRKLRTHFVNFDLTIVEIANGVLEMDDSSKNSRS